MSMGSFNPHRMYKQEDAMANAEAMAILQKLRGESFDKITNSVDKYGQSRQRGKVAELMDTDAYKNANPEDAMALVMQKTGGRDLGENHRKNMDVSYTGKGDVRKNTWDEEAATLSNSRANARQAQGHANSLTRMKIQNGYNQSNTAAQTLVGNKYAPEIKNIQGRIEDAEKIVNNPDYSAEMRSEAKKSLVDERIALELLLPNTNTTAGGQKAIAGALFPGSTPPLTSKTLPMTASIRAKSSPNQIKAYNAGKTAWDGKVWRFISDGVIASEENMNIRYGKK